MPQNRMQPETREENRDRLLEMSAAERRGFDQVSEGQLNPFAESIADPDGPEQELHELQDQLIMRPSLQDRADDESVQQTRDTIGKQLDERRAARAAGPGGRARGASRSRADEGEGESNESVSQARRKAPGRKR